MAELSGTVGRGGSVSQTLKDAGYTDYAQKSAWERVRSLNNLSANYTVREGQNLILGAAPAAPAPVAAPAPAAKPQSAEQVDPYLQNIQTQTAAQRSAPPVKTGFQTELESGRAELDALKLPQETPEQRQARIEAAITPEGERPEVPSLKEEFFSLREEYGLDGLEQQSTQIADDIFAIQNRLRERIGVEEGKPVPMSVIAGRINETERQELTRVDYLNRSATRINNQIQGAQSMISTMMQLTQTDYENARTSYNDQVQQKLETYRMVRGEEESDRDFNLRIMGSKLEISEKLDAIEQREIQKVEDTARANVEIMTNAITAGNIRYSDLSQTEKTNLARMEAQAGLPVGFTAKLQADQPEAEIISTTSRQDSSGMNFVDILTRDRRTGEIKVASQATGVSRLPSSGGSSSTKQTVVEKNMGKARAIVNEVNQSVVDDIDFASDAERRSATDNLLSVDEVDLIKQRLLEEVGDRSDAIELFNAVMEDMDMQLWEG